MCPCQPIDISDIIVPDPPSGFGGLPVPQLPGFDIPFPNLPIEDLLALFNELNMILPTGIFKPHLSSNFSKNALDAILSLLEKFMPFLMLYTFFMPILNMILCIIEILCAINNPFKLIKSLIRLFRVCIPEFLSLFPFYALILMIIALLLLILALILYLIQRIIDFIKQIIANIEMLSQAVNSADNDSVIAITIKLGDLLCIFQNLFVLLGVLLLIFEIIERLLNLSFKLPPCDDEDGSDDGCCTPDVCPSFIKNNKEIISNVGSLQYFNNVIQTIPLVGAVPIRVASFQLYDATASEALAFNNIIHAFDLPAGVSQVFFPEGETYTATTTPNRVPYTVDVRFYYYPLAFGRTDPKGPRFIRIKDCIVLSPPVDGVRDYQNNLIAPYTGTLSIAGGLAWEDDGTTAMKVVSTDTSSGTLNTVIAFPDVISANPVLLPTDGLFLDKITYTFKINHTILISKTLLTLGCHPDVALNKNFMNSTIASRLNTNAALLKSIVLPDVQATQDCIIGAITEFRQSVSVASAEKLQTTVTQCLTDLQTQTHQTLIDVIKTGADPFKSDFELNTAIQFTTKPIEVLVSLNEFGGNPIANNLPPEVSDTIESYILGSPTFGDVSGFKYDGTGKFIAYLTSVVAGNGIITVSFNNQLISILTNPADTTITPSVTTKELLYTFVQSSPFAVGTGGEAGAVGRDEGDIARDGQGE